MHIKQIVNYCVLVGLLLITGISSGISQKVTRISGQVIDSQTNEPLPFVNVYFKGTQIGASTDLEGNYSIQTRFPSDSLQATYLGYRDQAKEIFRDSRQEINFKLESTTVSLNTVTVKATKEKYSKKNNPAVELIQKVLANRKENSLKGQDYYSYDKYEKIEFDLNNITEKFRERNIFNKYQFVFDFVDTSEVNGKPYLPIFFRETLSSVYYRKNPMSEKEIKHGVNLTNISSTIEDKTIDELLNLLYEEIDIYDDKMMLLGNQFISPISSRAINFYRFYIQDTITVNDLSLIKLAFIPRNKLDMGFTGHLYISNDDRYFVKKADLGIINGINLNFVRDMKIVQEFTEKDDKFILDRDFVFVDYALTKNGVGAYGIRTNNFKNYAFEEPEDESIFSGEEKIKIAEDAYKKESLFWEQNRFEELNESEAGVFKMLDTLNNNPSFKRLKYAGYVLATGYVPYKGLEIGPVPTFISFNDVEGARYKFGGETNPDFAERIKLGGYVAYGTRDDQFKYSGTALISFGRDFRKTPFHHLTLDYTKDVTFPGVKLDFIKTDNLLLSFRRGEADRMLLEESYKANYLKEGKVYDFSMRVEKSKQEPIGALELPVIINDTQSKLTELNTFEVEFGLRFAPNETFVQGRTYRTPVLNRFPIFDFTYTAGLDGILDGEYSYHRASIGFTKKFYLGILGQTRFNSEIGKIWGQVPYLLYYIPRANQTYSYQRQSFNMMNFMEFAADEYFTVKFQHFFLGAIFNEIPLLKKLKLREIVTAKFLYGRLTDGNNPDLNPELVQFQKNADGEPLTYNLGNTPYFEGSVGVSNIFKFLRVDLVKRFTHLDNPNMPRMFGVDGLGLRFRIKVEF